METVAPLFTALIALSMAISTLMRGARDRLHQEFSFLAGVISIVFLCLFFLLLSKDEAWRYGLLASALLVAPASLQLFGQILRRYEPPFLHFVPILYALAVVQLIFIVLLGSRSSTVIITNGVIVFGGLILQIIWILRLCTGIDRTAERNRLLYLLAAGSLATLAMGLEMAFLDWNFWQAEHPGEFVLFPPFGSLATAGYIYFLGQSILRSRLLDSDEIISRIVVFIAMVILLGAVYGILVRLIGPQTGPFAEAVDILIASTLVLILYEPLKISMESYVSRFFYRERYETIAAIQQMQHRLPGMIEMELLLDTLFDGTLFKGRFDLSSLYLYDETRGGFRLKRWEGDPEQALLPAFPQHPFIDGFEGGRHWYWLTELESSPVQARSAGKPEWLEGVTTALHSLQAEACFPLRIGASIIGVWNLRVKPGAASLSEGELRLLSDVADQVAVLIDNSRAFERIKERDRLAALGQMSAGLAHEIRNPLGAIKGAVQLLAKGQTKRSDEFLGIIVEEVDRLDGVVRQFLDYARPTRLLVEPVHPDILLRGVLAMVEAQGLPNGVRVDYAPEASVPEVPMDVEKLKQVVLNIVLNGLEAMDERGGTLRVRARARRDGGEADALTSLRRFANGEFSEVRVKRGSVAGGQVVELVFEDEGDGIRQTDAGKLFIPFFTTKTEGNGLGLPICERIMREHGGEIEIESTAGRGTRFSLRLPLQQEPHPDPR